MPQSLFIGRVQICRQAFFSREQLLFTMRALMMPLSFPQTPTARPPACCMRVTSPLFTLPLSTISTTSIVGPANNTSALLMRRHLLRSTPPPPWRRQDYSFHVHTCTDLLVIRSLLLCGSPGCDDMASDRPIISHGVGIAVLIHRCSQLWDAAAIVSRQLHKRQHGAYHL